MSYVTVGESYLSEFLSSSLCGRLHDAVKPGGCFVFVNTLPRAKEFALSLSRARLSCTIVGGVMALLALLAHTPCGLSVNRRTVVVGGIASSLGLARRPLPALAAEPEAVQRLMALVEGRRAQQWRPEERAQVDRLIEEVVALQAPWSREDLRGRWKLAYLQPGPDGGGVDRRNGMVKRPRGSRCGHPTLPRPILLLRATLAALEPSSL